MIQVPIHNKDGICTHAIVDDSDAYLADLHWSRNAYGYAMRYIGGRLATEAVFIHRQIMGLKRGDPRVVDHINHDPMDNRRENLRIVSRGANCQHRDGLDKNNTSGARGVVWNPINRKWVAQVHHKGRGIYCGSFADKVEAAKAAATKRAELGFLGA